MLRRVCDHGSTAIGDAVLCCSTVSTTALLRSLLLHHYDKRLRHLQILLAEKLIELAVCVTVCLINANTNPTFQRRTTSHTHWLLARLHCMFNTKRYATAEIAAVTLSSRTLCTHCLHNLCYHNAAAKASSQ
jgi:hypothetical protein